MKLTAECYLHEGNNQTGQIRGQSWNAPLADCSSLRHRGRRSRWGINSQQWLSSTWSIGRRGLSKFTKGAETMHDFGRPSAAESCEWGGVDGCEAAEPEASIKHVHPADKRPIPRKRGAAHFVPVTSDGVITRMALIDSYLFNDRFNSSRLCFVPLASATPSTWLSLARAGYLKDLIFSLLLKRNMKWQTGFSCQKKYHQRLRNRKLLCLLRM